MEENIKSKNIKFNISTEEDKIIFNYFNENKANFSKITKKLLLEYIIGTKEEKNDDAIMDKLNYQTELLEKILNGNITLSSTPATVDIQDEQENNEEAEDDGFDAGFFLGQIQVKQ